MARLQWKHALVQACVVLEATFCQLQGCVIHSITVGLLTSPCHVAIGVCPSCRRLRAQAIAGSSCFVLYDFIFDKQGGHDPISRLPVHGSPSCFYMYIGGIHQPYSAMTGLYACLCPALVAKWEVHPTDCYLPMARRHNRDA